jgi:hypothetical protein
MSESDLSEVRGRRLMWGKVNAAMRLTVNGIQAHPETPRGRGILSTPLSVLMAREI